MAVCTVCGTGWCGCGGGKVCGDCRRAGKVRRLQEPSPGPTTRQPTAKPTAPVAPRTYVTMPGMGPTSG